MGSPEAAIGFLLYSTTRKDSQNQPDCFDTTSLAGLHSITANEGTVTAILPVTKRVQNRNDTLHGGCIATLIDVVGTAALLTVGNKGGVSLAINTNYLSAMPGGGDCLIEATVIRTGRTIATINVDLRDAETNKLVAQGTHVKFVSQTEPDLSVLAAKAKAAGLLPQLSMKTTTSIRSKL